MSGKPLSPALVEGPRGRALALAVTLAGVALLWFGLVTPVLDWHAGRTDMLERQSSMLERMRALAAAVPILRREAEAVTEDDSTDSVLAGASDAVAAATLQQALDDLAKAAGVRIGSAETLPSEVAGTWQAITVRVTLTAPWTPLVHLLQAIAAAPTAMVVDDLQLRPPPRDSRDPDRPIEAAFTVTAWRAREGGAS